MFIVSSASAECYVRSASVSQANKSISRIADLKREVLPVGSGKSLCRITFRAHIDGKWYLATGEETAHTWGSLDTACAKANQAAKTNILESVAGTKVSTRQDMICTDEPLPKTKPLVNVGDIIKESEVQPHPNHFDNFRFRGSLCRWFVESTPQIGKIDLNQGIICRLPESEFWKVVDKW